MRAFAFLRFALRSDSSAASSSSTSCRCLAAEFAVKRPLTDFPIKLNTDPCDTGEVRRAARCSASACMASASTLGCARRMSLKDLLKEVPWYM